jgi:hypothetical protein
MRMVSCSRCHGTGHDETIGSKCPDCNGGGKFKHWREGQDSTKLLNDLDVSRVWLDTVKQELMDYVSGGQYQDDARTRKDRLEVMRWDRDYWAFMVQVLQGELELMRGDGSDKPVATEYQGPSHRTKAPDGTGPGTGSLHEGGLADRDGETTPSVAYRIP